MKQPLSRVPKREREKLKSLLLSIIPFRFLKEHEIDRLASTMERHDFKKGQYIIRKGQKGKKGVYIVFRGEVEAFDPQIPGKVRIVGPGHYFGERVAIFDQPSLFEFRARNPVVCYMSGQKEFLELPVNSASFAMGFATILRDKQGIFSAFEHFSAELSRGINRGYTDLRALLKVYRALQPALHPHVNSPSIDTGALVYAIKRLPENVTRVFAYLLTDDLPTEFQNPDDVFLAVPSAARRRDIWELMPGKNMVLLRSGLSDLVDFVTCLLIYANEAAKIRERLHNPLAIQLIDSFLREHDSEALESCIDCRREFLEGLPFTRAELDGLFSVWPDDLVGRIGQILRHREVISLNFRRQVHNYYSIRSELWTHQIADATHELFSCEPANLPDSIDVHIISSNSHSVTNCINPFFVRKKEKILSWAAKTGNKALAEKWENPQDLLYALAPAFFAAHPEFRSEIRGEIEYGVYRLHHTASTGIQVQLIDTARLESVDIDPDIQRNARGRRKLVVNIDYAFGEQARDIIRNLILLFGRSIRSINVMGKAGGLVGRKGDVLLANAFIEQTQDQFYPLDDFLDIEESDMKKRLPGRAVYRGPVLTVAGTLLQNRIMLKFYRNLWNCIGLEMEGTHYHRQIMEAKQLEVIPYQVQLRYMYYVSDIPMTSGQSLSQSLTANEGLPPLYAITREILERIFMK